MTLFSKAGRLLTITACALGILATARAATRAQATPPVLTIALTGQSMVRSDLRTTAPKAIPVMQGLLKGDVIFTNLEAAVALPGQTVSEGRGFLAPPQTIDALKALGCCWYAELLMSPARSRRCSRSASRLVGMRSGDASNSL